MTVVETTAVAASAAGTSAPAVAPRFGIGPSRAELHRVVAPWARASSPRGYMAFAIDLAMFWGGTALVLLAPSLLAKLAGGALAGFAMVALGSLSHEAAHRAVVKSRLGNKIIAVVSLTMILFNYRLWVYDHHVLHHGRTNVKHNNFLSPLTLAEYRAMPAWRRAVYHAYHSPSGLGILLYYMLERWPTVHFWPGKWLPRQFHASAIGYAVLEAAWIVGWLTLLVGVAGARGESVAVALLCGFVLPCTAWFMTFSMTAFLQHTNPRLRWYRDTQTVASAPEMLSVQVLIPGWINHMTHYVLEHPVHHLTAMVPHYYLKEAQAALAKVAQPPLIAMQFTFGNMADALRRCKLYDYEAHVWTDFAGNVTGIPDDTVRARAAANAELLPDRADTSAGVFFAEAAGEPVRP